MEPSTKKERPCRFLRSKEMYHQAPGAPEDAFSAGAYWCIRTQEGFGPDKDPADPAECCPGRPCFTR
jgi:hypothetical protein